MLGLLGEARLPEADLALLRDYLALPDTRGTGRGLVASGSLSPPLAALYLAPLDYAMAQRMRRGQLVCYVRTGERSCSSGAPQRVFIFSVPTSIPAASFAHRARASVACACVLAGFMSKGPTSLGLTNLFILPFGATAPMLAATLRDSSGSYALPIVVLGSGMLIAAGALLDLHRRA
jgi:hypothetical protein